MFERRRAFKRDAPEQVFDKALHERLFDYGTFRHFRQRMLKALKMFKSVLKSNRPGLEVFNIGFQQKYLN